MRAREPALVATRVSRRYGRRLALQAVDLDVRRGEWIALVGPNGAGKSTLLALLAEAIRPSSGAVARTPGTTVGWSPQRPGHYGRLTVRENLELFARLLELARPHDEATRLLEAFDLPPDSLAANLSVGNRQRLNVAVSLLGDPDVCLLDEPTASLDPAGRRRLWEQSLEPRRGELALVFATQALEEADRADRVVVLSDGRVAFAGAPAELADAPAAALLA